MAEDHRNILSVQSSVLAQYFTDKSYCTNFFSGQPETIVYKTGKKTKDNMAREASKVWHHTSYSYCHGQCNRYYSHTYSNFHTAELKENVYSIIYCNKTIQQQQQNKEKTRKLLCNMQCCKFSQSLCKHVWQLPQSWRAPVRWPNKPWVGHLWCV